MINIVPISDLKNYTEVLSSCDDGSVVYLTRNGRGKYVVQSMLEYEKVNYPRLKSRACGNESGVD